MPDSQVHKRKAGARFLLGGIGIVTIAILFLLFLPAEEPGEGPGGVSAPVVEQVAILVPDIPGSVERVPSDNAEIPLQQERTVNEWLLSERPTADIADGLLELLPSLSGDAQVQAAGHFALLAEPDSLAKAIPLIGSPKLTPDAKTEIFSGIFTQDPDSAAQLLVLVLETGNEDFLDESTHFLSFLLQADHGNDVSAWKTELQQASFESTPTHHEPEPDI